MEGCADAKSSIYTAIAVLKQVDEPTLVTAIQEMGYKAYLDKYAIFASTFSEAEALDIGKNLNLAILVRIKHGEANATCSAVPAEHLLL